MFKKILIIFLVCLIPNITHASKILGVEQEQWKEDLLKIELETDDQFFEDLKENSYIVKRKYQSENFKKIDGIKTLKDQHRDNPLFRFKKHKSSNSGFLAKMDLNKEDYAQTLNYVKWLKKQYNREEIAQYIPYIALAINSDMTTMNINFYINKSVKEQTPIDIACMRLYNGMVSELFATN